MFIHVGSQVQVTSLFIRILPLIQELNLTGVLPPLPDSRSSFPNYLIDRSEVTNTQKPSLLVNFVDPSSQMLLVLDPQLHGFIYYLK